METDEVQYMPPAEEQAIYARPSGKYPIGHHCCPVNYEVDFKTR
jgi:hypothetical protein